MVISMRASFVMLLCGCIAVGAAIVAAATFRNSFHGVSLEKQAETEKRPLSKAVEPSVVLMSADQMKLQDIKVGPVVAGTLQRHFLASGAITPVSDRIARVPVRVVGTVAEMRKQLGDKVKADEIVAVLDSREVADAKSDYLTAHVNFDLQTTNYERAKSLWERRVSAEAQYLQAQAIFSEAQLRLDLARQKLSALGLDARNVFANSTKEEQQGLPSSLRKYELRAPISGRIIERKVDVGAAVGKEGDPSDVYMIADLSVVWADLSVPTFDLDQIKEGAAITVLSAGKDEERQEGKVTFISPVLSPDTRTARVIAQLSNSDGRWHPGSFITAEVETSRDAVARMIPRTALQTIDGKTVVFVRTQEGFEKRVIETGRKDDLSVEVISGLKAGEEIAIANSFLLKAELGKSDATHED